MKSLRLTASSLLLFSAILFTSCTKDQNENFYSTTQEFISKGKWTIDYYYAGTDKTALLSGYEFSFYSNGTVSGTSGANSFKGEWKVLRDVNYNDVLKITITTQDPHLVELNEQWNVTDKSISLISMKDNANQLRFRKL